MTRRIDRVNGLLRQEISRVLATELRDPRLSSLVTVMRVETSSDLRRAKVFVSVLADDAEKKSVVSVLRSAAGYIHRTVRDNVTLNNMPHLEFLLDDSIERGNEILELIEQVASESAVNEEEPES